MTSCIRKVKYLIKTNFISKLYCIVLWGSPFHSKLFSFTLHWRYLNDWMWGNFRAETAKLPKIGSHPRSNALQCKWETLTVKRVVVRHRRQCDWFFLVQNVYQVECFIRISKPREVGYHGNDNSVFCFSRLFTAFSGWFLEETRMWYLVTHTWTKILRIAPWDIFPLETEGWDRFSKSVCSRVVKILL